MISDAVRTRLREALEDDVKRYHRDTLVVRHQALCEVVAKVLVEDAGEVKRALRVMR